MSAAAPNASASSDARVVAFLKANGFLIPTRLIEAGFGPASSPIPKAPESGVVLARTKGKYRRKCWCGDWFRTNSNKKVTCSSECRQGRLDELAGRKRFRAVPIPCALCKRMFTPKSRRSSVCYERRCQNSHKSQTDTVARKKWQANRRVVRATSIPGIQTNTEWLLNGKRVRVVGALHGSLDWRVRLVSLPRSRPWTLSASTFLKERKAVPS